MITQKILHRPRTIVNHITLDVGEKIKNPQRLHSESRFVILAGTIQIGDIHGDFDSDYGFFCDGSLVLAPCMFMAVGKIPAELLEIRTGSYLGDDDIVPEPQLEPDPDGPGQAV